MKIISNNKNIITAKTITKMYLLQAITTLVSKITNLSISIKIAKLENSKNLRIQLKTVIDIKTIKSY